MNNVSYNFNMDNARQEQDMAELTVHQEPAEYHFSVPQQPVSQNTPLGTTDSLNYIFTASDYRYVIRTFI